MYIYINNSILYNTFEVLCTKLNKTIKQVRRLILTRLTAFRSQQLLVILTAVCWELKKEVRFNLKKSVNFMCVYIVLNSKLVYSYKTRVN